MSEEELNRHKRKLELSVAKWMTWGTTTEDLVADSVSDLWLNAANGKEVDDPARWLLVTASNKRKEHFRQTVRHAPSTDLIATMQESEKFGRRARFQFSKSRVWQSLTEPQKYAVIQVVMHDQSVSEIANELGLKRTTVKSWISRIPRRLAKDTYFQSLLGRDVNHG